MTDKEMLEKLSIPFENYKWKIQTCNKSMATFVAYIDARFVIERLNSVCGFGWKRKHERICENNYCTIEIWSHEQQQWISRMDIGTESFMDKEKGESSDAFKRSAVNFGIGLFLYELPIIKWFKTIEKSGKFYPVDNNGKQIYDVTEFINNKGYLNHNNGKEAVETKVKTTSETNTVISESQRKLLYAKTKDIPKDVVISLISDVCGVDSSTKIPKNKFNAILEEIEKL